VAAIVLLEKRAAASRSATAAARAAEIPDLMEFKL
jgi:hypothetical protein